MYAWGTLRATTSLERAADVEQPFLSLLLEIDSTLQLAAEVPVDANSKIRCTESELRVVGACPEAAWRMLRSCVNAQARRVEPEAGHHK